MIKNIKKILLLGCLFVVLNIIWLIALRSKIPIFYATMQAYVEYYMYDQWNWDILSHSHSQVFLFYYKIYHLESCKDLSWEGIGVINDFIKLVPVSDKLCVSLHSRG